MQQLSPKEVVAYMAQAVSKPVLVDVREPHELAICAIDGAVNIPLSQFAQALNTLEPEQEYVLICHHGVRSQRAGAFLAGHGYHKLINLIGGIDAWANDIAPEMARY